MTTGNANRGLDSPRAGRILLWFLGGVCALLAIAELFFHKHVHFAFEGWFAFYGWLGFFSCFFLITASKGLRKLVKRDEDYYDRDYR